MVVEETPVMDLLTIAWNDIKHRPLRSLLTISAVVIGVASVFTLIATIQGLNNSIRAEFVKFGPNKVVVIPGTITGANYGANYLTEEDVSAVENTPGVRYVLTLQTAQATAEAGQDTATITVFGVNPENFNRAFENLLGGYLKEGRTLDKQDRGKYVAFVGHTIAENVFSKKILTGSTIYINGKPFRIIGIIKKTGGPLDTAVYVPKKVFEDIGGERGKYVRIMAESADPEKTAERISTKLKRLHGINDFRVVTSEQAMQRVSQILQILGAFLVSVGAISLAIGAVGIMNTMYMNVAEKTREIGIMMAVGATKKQVMTIFLLEAGIIGAAGGVLGEMIGYAISSGIEMYVRGALLESYNAFYSPVLIVGLLAFSFTVGVVAGIFPARSGANLSPVEAMRK